jgi:hypothetical protein
VEGHAARGPHDLVRDGRQHGLLAYSHGKVVGWCNAKARLGYTS